MKQPPSKKMSPKPENPMDPKITTTKENHQRNFLERFCYETIVCCGTKGSGSNLKVPTQTSPENFN